MAIVIRHLSSLFHENPDLVRAAMDFDKDGNGLDAQEINAFKRQAYLDGDDDKVEIANDLSLFRQEIADLVTGEGEPESRISSNDIEEAIKLSVELFDPPPPRRTLAFGDATLANGYDTNLIKQVNTMADQSPSGNGDGVTTSEERQNFISYFVDFMNARETHHLVSEEERAAVNNALLFLNILGSSQDQGAISNALLDEIDQIDGNIGTLSLSTQEGSDVVSPDSIIWNENGPTNPNGGPVIIGPTVIDLET